MEENLHKISQEEIAKFMEGRDPQERIVNLSYNYQDNFISVFYRDEQDRKCVEKQPFYPFLWATYEACNKLCEGKRSEVAKLLSKFQIGVKKLSNTSIEGDVRHEFESGYMFMFYAKNPMSYSDFLKFFKYAKNPVYSNKKDEKKGVKDDNRQYLTVTPQEQFLISTGKRFFKGYTDYDQLLRMIFDLETEGLNPEKDRIKLNGVRLNRPVTINGKTYQNWGRIFKIEGETEEEKNESEIRIIDTFIKLIYTFKPDIITAHNGENFDWNFIIVRCKVLGIDLQKLCEKYFGEGNFIRKEERESVLKLGGEIETFHKTIVPDTIVTDSLHAVRRAQATDSNFKEANLKYSTKYLKLKKNNRVYTPGAEIDKILEDKVNKYAFNDVDGDWYVYDETSPNGKDIEFKKGKIGDKPFIKYTRNYLADGYEIVTGEYIINRYLLDDLWECDRVESKLNTANFFICKILPIPFAKCTTMGTAGQWKAIMLAWSYENNLAIPIQENETLKVGGLSRLLNVGFSKKILKFDYNSLYPSITLTWGIEDWPDLMGVTLPMLEFVLTSREKYKALKKKADKIVSKYDKKIIAGEKLTQEEEKEYQQAKADFALNDKVQNSFKVLGNSYFGSVSASNASVYPWKSSKNGHQITCTGRQCLRLLISHFSNLKGPNGETEGYGYKPLVGDTDGFNFQMPEKYRYNEENPYVSNGASRCTKKGEKYIHEEADLAEFNDTYMKDFHYTPRSVQKMGCDIDEYITSSLNASRKNYIDYFSYKPEEEQFKFVGNTVKSKKMPLYVELFINQAVPIIMGGDGQGFIEFYYQYLAKIYNYQIPLRDIATKGKIKKSIKEYLEDIKQVTKAGRPKSRQAWYELAIKNNLHVDNGDTIYYVNTGKSKSHADVKKITHYYYIDNDGNRIEFSNKIDSGYKKFKKDCELKGEKIVEKQDWIKKEYPGFFTEEEIVMNCILVPRDIVESEYDTFCNEENGIEYNVAKYVDMFNKRIKPLLVCFDKSIRDSILVSNPDERNYFTEEQCKMSSGEPNKPGDQDTYEQLMTMEDKEIKFWMEYDLIPPFIEECGMGTWESIKQDYLDRKEKERNLGIDKIREQFENIINKMTLTDIEDLLEEGIVPSSITKISNVDPITGNFVCKEYPDVVLSTLANIVDILEEKRQSLENSDFEEITEIAG